MSSKHYIVNGSIREGVRAENIRKYENIIIVSCIDSSNDIWIVENDNNDLYLEKGCNLCNPFCYS